MVLALGARGASRREAAEHTRFRPIPTSILKDTENPGLVASFHGQDPGLPPHDGVPRDGHAGGAFDSASVIEMTDGVRGSMDGVGGTTVGVLEAAEGRSMSSIMGAKGSTT